MMLIDRNGTRRRPICRECKKLHSRKECPKRASGVMAHSRTRAAEAMAVIYAAKAACR